MEEKRKEKEKEEKWCLAQPSMWPSRLTSHVYPHQDLIHERPNTTRHHPMLAASTAATPPLRRHSFSTLRRQPSSPPRSPAQLPLFACRHPKIHQHCHSHSNQKSSELLVGVLRQPGELKPMGMVVVAGGAWFPLALPFSNLCCCFFGKAVGTPRLFFCLDA
jgi:hypothetical protein